MYDSEKIESYDSEKKNLRFFWIVHTILQNRTILFYNSFSDYYIYRLYSKYYVVLKKSDSAFVPGIIAIVDKKKGLFLGDGQSDHREIIDIKESINNGLLFFCHGEFIRS